jgi:hypothetical protein
MKPTIRNWRILNHLSVHYKKFINPSSVTDADIKRELEYINRLEINVAYPFLITGV